MMVFIICDNGVCEFILKRNERKKGDRRLLRGIGVFWLTVLLGLSLAEAQLNTLTLDSDFNRTFNVRYNGVGYSLYWLGGEQASLAWPPPEMPVYIDEGRRLFEHYAAVGRQQLYEEYALLRRYVDDWRYETGRD